MVNPFTRLAIPISITRPGPGDRLRDFSLIVGLLLWLAYTRIFWTLQVGHWTLPPCPFYYLTGHPCPFCGGTRSFAYMWEGDVADASFYKEEILEGRLAAMLEAIDVRRARALASVS